MYYKQLLLLYFLSLSHTHTRHCKCSLNALLYSRSFTTLHAKKKWVTICQVLWTFSAQVVKKKPLLLFACHQDCVHRHIALLFLDKEEFCDILCNLLWSLYVSELGQVQTYIKYIFLLKGCDCFHFNV